MEHNSVPHVNYFVYRCQKIMSDAGQEPAPDPKKIADIWQRLDALHRYTLCLTCQKVQTEGHVWIHHVLYPTDQQILFCHQCFMNLTKDLNFYEQKKELIQTIIGTDTCDDLLLLLRHDNECWVKNDNVTKCGFFYIRICLFLMQLDPEVCTKFLKIVLGILKAIIFFEFRVIQMEY